jgi:molecular chaperone DnaK
MALAVGIDLGTTNTVVAAVRDGVATVLRDADGRRLLPSVVSFHPSGSVVVGCAALERRLIDAPNTIYSVKRLIGRSWLSPEVQQAQSKLPFELRQGPNGATLVAVRGEVLSLPEISAFVLRQTKEIAEQALGERVERAVITVPANFNDLQRAASKTAGRLADLEVLRILNEPTAAALAYGPQSLALTSAAVPHHDRSLSELERIAVYDLGGGTFDVTLLDLAGNVFEVLATAGDTALGGDDIDVMVAERMADDLLKSHRLDARADPSAFGRLRILAEHIKRELSTRDEYTITADDLLPGERGRSASWQFRMTRPELEWASLALVERTFKVCQRAFDAAGVEPAEISRVILVGGSTRMPMVARKVEQYFGRAPTVRINPDEVVALGAGIQAALLDRSRQRGTGPVQHPRIAHESVVQLLPADDTTDAGMPNLPVVGPKHAVKAEPAGSPVGVFLPGAGARPLVFEVPDARAEHPIREPARPAPLLIDVTPLSLSVETVGGYGDVLIEANTPVPCDRTRNFATASAGQTTATVRVAQGESKRFAENVLLGEVELSGIAPAARGEARIAVTFEIDADGILNVRARDQKTGRETVVRIQLVGAPTNAAEMEAMRARHAAHPLAVPTGPAAPR